jgi:signal transduction histidine kinase
VPQLAEPYCPPNRSALKRRYRRAAAGLGLGVAVLGGVALLGWLFRSPLLTGSEPSIKVNTAVSLLLLGLALHLRGHQTRRARLAAAVAAAMVVLVALLTLAGYLGLDLAIDNLLVAHPVDGTRFPGRMSLVTVSALLLLGPGVLLTCLKRDRRRTAVAQMLGLGGLLIGLFALLGHIYQAHVLLRVDPQSGSIALGTTAGILAAGLGLLFVAPSGLIMEVFSSASPAGREARYLVFIHLPWLLIVVTLLTGWERAGGLRPGEAAALRNLALFTALFGLGWRAFRKLDQAEGAVRRALHEAEGVRNSLQLEVAERRVAVASATIRVEASWARLQAEAAETSKLLEQRNRDLETLLHVVSHDLKEPLRSIESFSRLLASRHQGQLDARGLDFLDRVVRAGGRMGQLLEEIQLLARVRRAEPAEAHVDGEEVVQEVLARLDGAIRETGASVTVEPSMPRLRVERVWATQALYNLVANALKFRRDGALAEVRVAPWGQDGLAGFQVLDRGPGVPSEQAERIFQLFQRGVGREVPGTGAGLAIVRQIAERHGGQAWVEPRQGGGSVFTVTFAADGGKAA